VTVASIRAALRRAEKRVGEGGCCGICPAQLVVTRYIDDPLSDGQTTEFSNGSPACPYCGRAARVTRIDVQFVREFYGNGERLDAIEAEVAGDEPEGEARGD
jgi:hypothetical protein